MKSDWLGSLKTPDHLLEVVTPRAPQGYPNFSTGEEKSGHHNIFWLTFSCPADPSSFPQGQTWIYQRKKGTAFFHQSLCSGLQARGAAAAVPFPASRVGAGSAPLIPHCQDSSTSSKRRIDYSRCPPLTPVPADGSHLEEPMYTTWQAHTFLGVLGITREMHNLTRTWHLLHSLKKPQVPPQRKPKRSK